MPPSALSLELLYDCRRAVQQSFQGLNASCLQAHYGLLPFCPSSSKLRKLYAAQAEQTVKLVWGAESQWDPCVLILEARSQVRCAVFSDDGQQIASTSINDVTLWDANTGTRLHTLPVRISSRDDRFPAASSIKDGSSQHDSSVRNSIANDSSQHDGSAQRSDGNESSRRNSPDGSLLGDDSSQRDSSVDSSRPPGNKAPEHAHPAPDLLDEGSPRCASFSPDGRELAVGTWRDRLLIWDTATGRRIVTQRHPYRRVSSVSYSPDGQLLASTADSQIFLWDRVCPSSSPIATLEGHSDIVCSAQFSPQSGNWLASCDCQAICRIWDVKARACTHTFQARTDTLDFEDVFITFSPNELLVACQIGTDLNCITVYDIPMQRILRLSQKKSWFSKRVYRGGLPFDDLKIFAVDHSGKVKVLNLTSGRIVSMLQSCRIPPSDYRRHSQKGQSLLTYVLMNVYICDVGYAHALSSLRSTPSPGQSPSPVRSSDRARTSITPIPPAGTKGKVALSPDGVYMAIEKDSSTVLIWNRRTGTCTETKLGRGDLKSLDFSLDASVLISSSVKSVSSHARSWTVGLWNILQGRFVGSFELSNLEITSPIHAGFSARSKEWVVCIQGWEEVQLWAIGTSGQQEKADNIRHTLVVEADIFHALSPDASYMLFSTRESVACILDVETRKSYRLAEYRADTEVQGCFSSDSSRLVVLYDADTTSVCIYDVLTLKSTNKPPVGYELPSLTTLQGVSLTNVFLSPDEKGIVTNASFCPIPQRHWPLSASQSSKAYHDSRAHSGHPLIKFFLSVDGWVWRVPPPGNPPQRVCWLPPAYRQRPEIFVRQRGHDKYMQTGGDLMLFASSNERRTLLDLSAFSN